MKYAIISDIHSNLQALNSALDCIRKEGVDEILCLGDIVGYNANPNECIEIVRTHPKIKNIVQGNHDAGVIKLDRMSFSERQEWSDDAINGLCYSRSVITEDNLKWLKDIPERIDIKDSVIPFHMCHYSPWGMGINWGYILDKSAAQDAIMWLQSNKINLAFFGHSHLPTVANTFSAFSKDIDFLMGPVVCEVPVEIEKDKYYVINSGAIGQPRNKGETTYAIYDTSKMRVDIKPFEYDISEAQKSIMNSKYSNSCVNLKLAKRLGDIRR